MTAPLRIPPFIRAAAERYTLPSNPHRHLDAERLVLWVIEMAAREDGTHQALSTDDVRNAPAGIGPFACEWADKPHRLLNLLCREVDALRAFRPADPMWLVRYAELLGCDPIPEVVGLRIVELQARHRADPQAPPFVLDLPTADSAGRIAWPDGSRVVPNAFKEGWIPESKPGVPLPHPHNLLNFPTATAAAHALQAFNLGPAAVDWPDDFPHENGAYHNRCTACGVPFLGHKRRVVCRVCASRPAADPQIPPPSR